MNSRALLGVLSTRRHCASVYRRVVAFRAVLVSALPASDLRSWPHCLQENGHPTRGLASEPQPRVPRFGLTLSPRLTSMPKAPASSCSGFLTFFLFPECSPLAPSFLLKSPWQSLRTRSQAVLSARWRSGPHHRGGEGPSAPSLGADRRQIFCAEVLGWRLPLGHCRHFPLTPLSYLPDGSNVPLFSKGLAWYIHSASSIPGSVDPQ